MKQRIILSVILVLIVNLVLIGQHEIKILTPKKMERDLKVLLETLEGHPDPYAKIEEKEFQKLVKQVEKEISQDLDEIDFFKHIARLVASIGDGHSSAYMPRFWMKKARIANGAFPCEVYLSNDNELFVIKSYGKQKIPLGAQILEINGKPIDDFVAEVAPYVSHETIPFRNVQISENFDLMLYLVFKQVDDLVLKIKTSNTAAIKVYPMPYKDWRIQKKDLREEREKKLATGKPYDFKIVETGVAKIDIFSFSVTDIERFKFFLDKTFKQIKKERVHSLIIDVRGNYGGWPKVASELFHYIHEGHFKTMAKSSMKISFPYRTYFTDKNPMLKNPNVIFTQRRHFLDIEAIVRGQLGTFKDEELFFNEAPITKNHEFEGDTYVLIDRQSYSASSSFASTFQCYSMGYLIGESTGGTKIFRANAFRKQLPRSTIILTLSTTKLYTACYDQENEPVKPNVEVETTILDRAHGFDAQLFTALTLIKQVQEKKTKK